MARSKDEMKALLAAEADTIIDELLAAEGRPEQMTLTEIEDVVLGASHRLQAVLTRALIEAEEVRESRPKCPSCGAGMRHQGYREKRMVTRTGEVSVRRAYYRCETCGSGFFPPG